VKLVDTEETVVLVTGSGPHAEEADRPLAYRIQREIDARGSGLAYRRAVVVSDMWYLQNRTFQLNPTVAIGGPGANAVAAELSPALPMVHSEDERLFVQASFDSDRKRAVLWGSDRAATGEAVEWFIRNGLLDDLLERIWRFRGGVFV
jgi:hypothetical protein